jgi:DNA-binding transcriptional LysR family regulator
MEATWYGVCSASSRMAKPIELRQLRYFVVLAEELHFSRAAQRLGISQPPLTRQIQELEKELGTRLFERDKHLVELTAAGRVFIEETRKTLEQVARSQQLVRRAARGELGQLSLGVAPLLEASIYPALEAHVRRAFPHLEIKRHVLGSEEQAPLIRQGSLDAGLVRLPLEEHDLLTVEFLFREGLLMMMRDDNELAKRRAVRMGEFCGQNRVVIRKKFNSALYRYIDDLCRRNGYRAVRVVHVDTIPELLNAVLKGDGVAVVPSSLKRQVTSGLRYTRFIEKNADIQVGLVRPRDHGSPALQLVQRTIHEMPWPTLL